MNMSMTRAAACTAVGAVACLLAVPVLIAYAASARPPHDAPLVVPAFARGGSSPANGDPTAHLAAANRHIREAAEAMEICNHHLREAARESAVAASLKLESPGAPPVPPPPTKPPPKAPARKIAKAIRST